ncbi:MAG TPA: hypothetical protein VFO42_03525 [Sphingomicrobium sp.]|nr:hypothetical protein [Sphingomicrobium sp.]
MPNNVKTVPLTPTPTQQWHPVAPVVLPPNSGEWLISFKLTGANANNVTFDRNDPIWVRAGQKPDQSNKENAQILGKYVTDNGKELVVLSRNNNPADDGPVELHYRLNFDGYPDLDPIIENGGGPKLVSDAYDAVTVGIFVVVAFLVGILAHWGYRKLT